MHSAKFTYLKYFKIRQKTLVNQIPVHDKCQLAKVANRFVFLLCVGLISGVGAKDNNYNDWQYPLDTYYGYYAEAPYNVDSVCKTYNYVSTPPSSGAVYYQNVNSGNPSYFLAAVPINQNAAGSGVAWKGKPVDQPVVCGANGDHGDNYSSNNSPHGGKNGAMSGSIFITHINTNLNTLSGAMAVINLGGKGGKGGNGSPDGVTGAQGGWGGYAGDVTLTFAPAGQNSYYDTYTNDYGDTTVKYSYQFPYIVGYNTANFLYTALWAQAIGGNGGDGGSHGGDGSPGGIGGTVSVNNSVAIYSSNGYGIYAQSAGGWGGRGTDANMGWYVPGGGSGGDGSAGASGGKVIVNNYASITTPNGTPIFAQSIGGNGGSGGNASGGWYGIGGGSGGSGGWGGPAQSVNVLNYGTLSGGLVGGYGIFAQSVGGGGGDAGASKGLYALGAAGGVAASGSQVGVSNYGNIYLSAPSSVGIFAQSIGGGGGAGGMAAGVLAAIGGSGGGGGSGDNVSVVNNNNIYTGNSCYGGVDSSGNCKANVWYADPNTPVKSNTNGGAFGILAQSIGGGGGSGGAGYNLSVGSMGGAAFGGSGGGGGSGGTAYVLNVGSIQTREPNSAGILTQSIGGGGGSGGGALNLSAGISFAFGVATGGSAGPGGDGGLVGVNCLDNSTTACAGVSAWGVGLAPRSGATINTNGVGSPGIIAQSIGGGGGSGGYAASFAVSGGASASLAFGGTGGAGGKGSAVYASPSGVNILTTGSDSPGIIAASIGGGGGTGGQSISGSVGSVLTITSSLGGSGANGGAGGSVTLSNVAYSAWISDGSGGYSVPVSPGVITTYGDRSYGLIAQSIGGGGGSGGASVSASISRGATLTQTIGGTGGKGGNSDTVTVNNSGAIQTYGIGSSAIVAQSISGGGGSGGASLSNNATLWGSSFTIGGAGGSGGQAGSVNVANYGAINMYGSGAPVILAQSIAGGGGNGGASTSGTYDVAGNSNSIGGKGGGGGVAGAVLVNNQGFINSYYKTSSTTVGGNSPGILAQSIGGGGGNGGYAFGSLWTAASNSFVVGGTGGKAGSGSSVAVGNSMPIYTEGSLSPAIIAQSIGGSGGNGGQTIVGGVSGGFGISTNVGGKGADGGSGGAINVVSWGALSTHGLLSPVVLLQSIGGAGGNGGTAIGGGISLAAQLSGAVGGEGGVGGKASTVTATLNGSNGNSALISTGDQSPVVLAQSIGGNGGNGGNAISGAASGLLSGAYAIGGTGGGCDSSGNNCPNAGDVKVVLNGNTTFKSEGLMSPAVLAQSIGGSGGNGGLTLSGAGAIGAAGDLSIGGNGGKGASAGAVIVNTDWGVNLETNQAQSPGILAQSIGGSGGNGGKAGGVNASSVGVGLAIGGSGGNGASGGGIALTNYAGVSTAEVLSPGVVAQSIGGAGGNGGFSVGLSATLSAGATVGLGGSGGSGGVGQTVTVTNSGSISTNKGLSPGVLAQSIGGSGGSGGMSLGLGLSGSGALSLNLGGSGGTGGYAWGVYAYNYGAITTKGNVAAGIIAQSIGGSGGNGGNAIGGAVAGDVSLSANIGGAAGSGNGSYGAFLSNSNSVQTAGDQSPAIVAQSIGGTGGNGGNAVTGSFSGSGAGGASIGNSGGKGGTAGDATVALYPINAGTNYTLLTTGKLSPAVLLQSIGGSGGNGGLSVSGAGSFGTSASVSLGGNGGEGGTAALVEFTTSGGANIKTSGSHSAGIVAQSIGGNGGSGGTALSGAAGEGFSASVAVGGGGGSGGKGGPVSVNLNNADQGMPYGIVTEGLMSAGIIAQSISGQGGNGGTAINGSVGGGSTLNLAISGYGGDANSSTGAVTVTTGSQTSITTKQDQSSAILAQSIGGSGGNGGLAISGTASIDGSTASFSLGGSGGTGGNANAVTVNSGSEIKTVGALSTGIIAQSIGGGGGNGGSTFSASSATSKTDGAIVNVGLGGSGGVGGKGGTVTVTQGGNITTGGCDTTKTACDQSAGILAQSIGGGGGSGGSAFAFALQGLQSVNLNVGGRGGSGGVGGIVNVQSNQGITSGMISTTGALSNAVFAQSLGGGGGSGGYATSVTVANSSPNNQAVELSAAIGGSGGGGGSSSAVNVTTGGTLMTSGNQAAAIYAQSVGGGGGSGGSSFSYFSGRTSALTSVASLAASYGSGVMQGSSGGDSSSSSGNPVDTSAAPSMSKSSSGGTAIALSVGGNGGNGGFSGNVVVNSASFITTAGDSSQGIFAQSVGGGGGSGGSSTSKSGSGRYVISGGIGGYGGIGGIAGEVQVTSGNQKDPSNTQLISTAGLNSAAIYAQSVGGGGGSGGSTSSTASSSGYAIALGVGGFGGSGNTGGKVTVQNSAQLVTAGANSAGIYAQSVGGGGGDGGTSSVSAAKPNPTADSLAPPSVVSYVGSLSSKTAGKSSTDGGPSSAAGQSTTQKGSQAGGSSKETAIGLSLGGFGGTGGNAGAVSITNSGEITTGVVITSTNSNNYTLMPAIGPTGISNAADYSYGIFAQSIGGGGGSGGQSSSEADTGRQSISLAIGGAGSGGGLGNDVSVKNAGYITTYGAQAAAIFAQSVGGGGGIGGDSSSSTNFISARSYAVGLGGSGAAGGSGGNTTVNTNGVINTYGLASDGIFAQSVGGGGGRGGSSATAVEVTSADVENLQAAAYTTSSGGGASAKTSAGIAFAAGLGGAGGAGGSGGNVSVSSQSQITTQADSSSGIFAQSVGGGGGSAGSNTNHLLYATYSFNASLGSSGTAGNGGNVSVASGGDIKTNGQSAFGIFAQSVGGGGGIANSVNNTGSTSGDADVTAILGANGGSNLLAGTVTLGASESPMLGLITTKGAGSAAVVAQSIGGGGGVVSSNNITSSSGAVTANATLGAVKDSNGGASTGGNASTVQIFSNTSISTEGNTALGMVAQAIGGGGGIATFNNASASSASLKESYLVGAQNGSTGVGGAITATLGGSSIITQGTNAIGAVAQSIGGGGGMVLANNASTSNTNQIATANMFIGGSGAGKSNGNSVTMTVGNSIQTGVASTNGNVGTGANSIGIFAQSIGGGGGMVASTFSAGTLSLTNLQIGGQSGVSGDGANVSVTQKGQIVTQGPAAVGILAQSVGGGGGYAALASLQGNTAVSTPTNVTIGGASNVSGNGGDVKVTVSAPITTYGKNSVGVIAQSVGGGGGVLLTSGLMGEVNHKFTGGTGNGGNVTVDVNQPITINGAGVYGVIAQSIGGGGGIIISETGVIDKTGKGCGIGAAGCQGGIVTVNVNSAITVNGKSSPVNVAVTNGSPGAYGVYARSLGSADPDVTVAKGASIIASGGATAIAIDGLVNNVTNHGYIGVMDSKQDTAIKIRGLGGNTTITNNGVFSGSLDNIGSSVRITNSPGAKLYLANSPNLGFGGDFVNAGYLKFSSEGLSGLPLFAYRERLQQTSTGVLGINFDFKKNVSEILHFEKRLDENNLLVPTNVILGGRIHPVLVNAGLIAPGNRQVTIINKNVDTNLRDEELGVINTAIMTYGLIKDSSKVQLTAKADFVPAGLSPFGKQMGTAIGTFQTAGSNAFFQAATAQLVTIPTVGTLDQAYANLAGYAIQAMPQVNYQAVTRAIGTISDRMNSWRVGDSFIATAKNPRALMTGMASLDTPMMPNAPQVTIGSPAVDDGLLPRSKLAKSTDARTWITPFGGISNSNNLATQIYGGSLGIEAQSDDGRFIGGAAFTVSQSNYTYSSSTTPATPGSATNYGASFYLGARSESAYISAIAYLGGSSGNFTRQLQALEFSTSAGVNVHSNIMAARIEAGYNLLRNPQGKASLQITPFVAIAPTQIRQNGANETFGSLGSGFYYGSNINTAVPVYLGTEISGEMQMGHNEVMKPFLRVSWAHDLMSPMTMSAAYTPSYGPTLYANGTPTMGNMVIVKGGGKYNWGTKVSAFATIDVEQGNAAYSYRGIGGSIGVIYRW